MATSRWNVWFCLLLVISIIICIRLGQSHPFYRRTMDVNTTTDDSFPELPVTSSDDRESAVSVLTECDLETGRANVTVVVFPGERFVTYTQVICHNNVFPVLMGFSMVYFPNATMRDHQFLCLFDGPHPDFASTNMIYNASVSLFWDDGKGSLFESKCLVSKDMLSMEVDPTTLMPDSTSTQSVADVGVMTDVTDGPINIDAPTHPIYETNSKSTECKNRSSENLPPEFPVGAAVDSAIVSPPSTNMNSVGTESTPFSNETVKSGSGSTTATNDSMSDSKFSPKNMVPIENGTLNVSTPSNQKDIATNQTSASPATYQPGQLLPRSPLSSSVADYTTVSSIKIMSLPIQASSLSIPSKTVVTVGQDRSEIPHTEPLHSTISASKTMTVSYDELLTSAYADTDSLQISSTEVKLPKDYDEISSTEDVSSISSEARLSRLQTSEASSSTAPSMLSTISSTEFMLASSEEIVPSVSSDAMIFAISSTTMSSVESEALLTRQSLTKHALPPIQSTVTISPPFHYRESMSTSVPSTEAISSNLSSLVIKSSTHDTTTRRGHTMSIQPTPSTIHLLQSSISVHPKTSTDKQPFQSISFTESESTSSQPIVPLPKRENAKDVTSDSREALSDSKRNPSIVRVSSKTSGVTFNRESTINNSLAMTPGNGTLPEIEHPNNSPDILPEANIFSKAESGSPISSPQGIVPTRSSPISEYTSIRQSPQTSNLESLEGTPQLMPSMDSESQFSLPSQETEAITNLMSPSTISGVKLRILETPFRSTELDPSSFRLSIITLSSRIHSENPMYSSSELEPSTASMKKMKTPYLSLTGSLLSPKTVSFTADTNLEGVTKTQSMLRSQLSNDVLTQSEKESDNNHEPLRISRIQFSNKNDSQENVSSPKPTKDEMPTETPTKDAMPTEKPITDSVPTDKPTKDAMPTEQPMTDSMSTEKPMTDTMPTEKPTKDEMPTEKPMTDSMPPEKPMTDSVPTEKPMTDSMPPEKPMTDSVPTEKPMTNSMPPEKPMTDSVPTEKPMTDSMPPEKPMMDSVPTEKPITDSVPTETQMTDSMPPEKPITDSVPTEKPMTDSMPPEKPMTDSVPTEKPMTDSVPTEKQMTDSVPTEKPMTDSVPTEKTTRDSMQEEKSTMQMDENTKTTGKPMVNAVSSRDANPKKSTTETTSSLSSHNSQFKPSSSTYQTTTSLQSNIIRSFLGELSFNDRYLRPEMTTSSPPKDYGPPRRHFLPNPSTNSVSDSKFFTGASSYGPLNKEVPITTSAPKNKTSTTMNQSLSLDAKSNVKSTTDGMPRLKTSDEAMQTRNQLQDTYSEVKLKMTTSKLSTDFIPTRKPHKDTETTVEPVPDAVTTIKTFTVPPKIIPTTEEKHNQKPTDTVSNSKTTYENQAVKPSTKTPLSLNDKTTTIQQPSETISILKISTQSSPRSKESTKNTIQPQFSTERAQGRSRDASIHDSTTPTEQGSTNIETMQNAVQIVDINSKEESTDVYSQINIPTTEAISVSSQESSPIVSSPAAEAVSTTATPTKGTSSWSFTTVLDTTKIDKSVAPPLRNKIVQSKSNIFIKKQSK